MTATQELVVPRSIPITAPFTSELQCIKYYELMEFAFVYETRSIGYQDCFVIVIPVVSCPGSSTNGCYV